MTERRVILGVVGAPHGVKGCFAIKTFTARPEDVAGYGPVETGRGEKLALTVLRRLKPDVVLARAEGIADRTAAEKLRGAQLSISRSALPPPEDDEFYIDDLVGLAAQTTDGAPCGRIAAVYDFGAGPVVDLADIPGRKGTALLAFTKANFPRVDLEAGRIEVAADALEESAETDKPAPSISDDTGQIVSDDRAVDLDAMREEDA